MILHSAPLCQPVALCFLLQFCMAMPSDIMMAAALNLDWVTNARASNDYAEGDNLERVPAAGLLMWALGMRPSKDK